MFAPVTLKRLLSTRFFFLAIAYLSFMTLVMFFLLKPLLQNIVVRSNESLATALAVQAENYLLAPQRSLTVVAERIGKDDAQFLPLASLLDALVASSDIFEAIYILDREGGIVDLGLPAAARNREVYMNLDLSGSVLFADARRNASAGGFVWSSVFLSAVTGRLAVAVALPAGDNTVIGEVGLANLSEFVRRVASREKTTMVIVDGRGQILAHPDVKVASQQLNISDLSLLKAGGGAALRTEVTSFEGVEVIGTRAPIAGIDWVVLVTQPLSVARQPIAATVAVLTLIGLLVTAVAIWLGIALSRRLADVFERLVGTAELVAVGRYPTIWPRSRVVEFGRLIESLRRMSLAVHDREAALACSQNELVELNQSLEQRVDERTALLAKANTELQSILEQLSQTQEELQRTERLAALGALVAGVAHELNTPIGNCLVVASACAEQQSRFEAEIVQGLKRTSLNALTEGNRTAMKLLGLNLRRAAELISSFKQVAVDRTTSQRRQYSLHDTIREIVITVSPSVNITGCRVVFDVTQNIQMEGFPGPLGQVMSNLIENAVVHAYSGRALPGGGEISIRAQLLESDWVEVIVADNGVGIPPEHIKRVFDPFFTTRRGQGGTGLGLNIVYNVVNDLLGGNIRAESEVGHGTRFILRLPRVAPALDGAK